MRKIILTMVFMMFASVSYALDFGCSFAEHEQGYLITYVEKKSIASQMSLSAGDIITHVDDKSFDSFKDFLSYISNKSVGEKISITVLSENKKYTMSTTPEDDLTRLNRALSYKSAEHNYYMELQRSRYPDNSSCSGLVFDSDLVLDRIATRGFGINPAPLYDRVMLGSKLISINGIKITSLEQYNEIIKEKKIGEYINVILVKYKDFFQREKYELHIILHDYHKIN